MPESKFTAKFPSNCGFGSFATDEDKSFISMDYTKWEFKSAFQSKLSTNASTMESYRVFPSLKCLYCKPGYKAIRSTVQY